MGAPELLTGDLVDAATALRIGLVHEVVETGAVQARAYALAATLSSRARVSLVGGKALVARCARGELGVDEQVEPLDRSSWGSAECAEGVAAFLPSARRTSRRRAGAGRPRAAESDGRSYGRGAGAVRVDRL